MEIVRLGKKATALLLSIMLVLSVMGAVFALPVSASAVIVVTVTPVDSTAAHGNPEIASEGDVITFMVSISDTYGTDFAGISFILDVPPEFSYVPSSLTPSTEFLALPAMEDSTDAVAKCFAAKVSDSDFQVVNYEGPGLSIGFFKYLMISDVNENATVDLGSVLLIDSNGDEIAFTVLSTSISAPPPPVWTTTITVPPVTGATVDPYTGIITDPAAVQQGETVYLPAVTARTGFIFKTWYVTEGLTEGTVDIADPTSPSYASFVMGAEDVTIEARFDALPLTFGDVVLPGGAVDATYSANVTAATGGSGSYEYTISGQPSWLSLSAAGLFSGTPDVVATNATFTITATDVLTGATADATYTLTVGKGAQTLIAADITRTLGNVNSSIDLTGHATSLASADGGAITYAITRAGAGATISGTTLSYTSAGTATITATAAGNGNYNAATAEFTLTVNLPAISGVVTIGGASAIGEVLTVNTSAVTVLSGGAFNYQWQAGGVNIGTNNPTYTLTGAEAGKAITCIVTNTHAAGSLIATLTGGLVPYNITVINVGNVPADTIVTISPAIGRADDRITLSYGLANLEILNMLTFTGATGLVNLTAAGQSITQNYIVDADDAVNGLITITATFTHSDKLARTLSFPDGNQTRTYPAQPFTFVAIANPGAGGGTIVYTSSNPAVATVNASTGQVTIVGAGSTTITASIAEDFMYVSATASYVLTVGNASQTAPTGLSSTNQTAVGVNNGTITGVNNTMEFRNQNSILYTAVTGTAITDLAPGTYLVRFAAKTNYDASADTTLTIAAYTPPQPGGTGSGGGGLPPSPPANTPETEIEDEEVPLAEFRSFAPFVTGYPDSTFRGDNNMSREEFVTILYRLMNGSELPVANAENPSFNDVAPGWWTYDAIEWALGEDIISVDDDGNFRPGYDLTRADMVVMLVKALGWTEMAENTLSDIDDHPALDDILRAISAGIVTGYPDGTFRPDDNVTRYEVVTAVVRYWLGEEPTDDMWEEIDVTLTDVRPTFWAYKYVALATVGYVALPEVEETP